MEGGGIDRYIRGLSSNLSTLFAILSRGLLARFVKTSRFGGFASLGGMPTGRLPNSDYRFFWMLLKAKNFLFAHHLCVSVCL